MTIDCPTRQALIRIAQHMDQLAPVDREMLRPAIAAMRDDVEVIHVPDTVLKRIRDIDARMPKREVA